MSNSPYAFITAMPGAIRRGWRGMSGRKRTFVALALWILVWQGILAGLRALEDPALSALQVTALSGETTTLPRWPTANPWS